MLQQYLVVADPSFYRKLLLLPRLLGDDEY